MLHRVMVTILVLLHHGIAYHHGAQHTLLAIDMAAWQNAFINGVILVLPLLGVVMLWTPWRRAGAVAVIVGMLGALIFGVVHHYMLVSPDHISHLPAAEGHVHAAFIWTAGAIAMLEGIAAMWAALLAGQSSQSEFAP
ncbi:MAG: hypothetical protein AAF387_21380 [Pseudomonadota bacterium]